LTLGDSEGEGTCFVVSVVDAASSTSEVSDIIAIDGSLGGRASPRFPPRDDNAAIANGGRERGMYLLLLVFWLLCGICFTYGGARRDKTVSKMDTEKCVQDQ